MLGYGDFESVVKPTSRGRWWCMIAQSISYDFNLFLDLHGSAAET